MQTRPYTYLFRIQYLGLRYHGWQVQKGVKTIQGTLHRRFRYLLGHEDFTLLGASRTDSGVSCLNGAFELFLKHPLDTASFLFHANENLPPDIRLLSCQPVPASFNIIQDVCRKQYGYFFSVGEKPHPFLTGTLAYAGKNPNLPLMEQGASLFQGQHDFRRFCSPGKNTENFIRQIDYAAIHPVKEDLPWLPTENTWVFRVKGAGFLMHQVRRMAASLFMLGNGELSLDRLEKALQSTEKSPLCPKPPAVGLVLEEVTFRTESLDIS
ncbi:tRNA pseudouridine(38-40) synthase TruA [Cyclobacterium salsum]|uniref:tRNA pseudouridine(38-40) synthase TruA n=1 Tax=Cyclobacterium salsum TaxID=2666329 RepID=UPI001390DE36|nr:tRNA pseudouridine(38-40) synthase TruA [Cyclobacterium salsum]